MCHLILGIEQNEILVFTSRCLRKDVCVLLPKKEVHHIFKRKWRRVSSLELNQAFNEQGGVDGFN